MPVRNTAWPQGTPCWVDCQVDDPVKESEFYTGLFGWDVQLGDDESGYLMAMRDGRPVAGIGPKPQADLPAAWTTYLAVTDADLSAAAVTAAGGQLVVPPFDVLDAGRMFVATDTVGAVFAVWQARAHNGAAVYNEHGAYCWNELHTRQLDAAKRFYAEVFEYTYTDLGDGTTMRYAMFTPPGATEAAGGMNDDTVLPGEPMPSYWLSWFQFDGVDEGVSRSGELGGAIMMPPTDSPAGRMAVLVAPQGESFGIIDTAVRVGEMPQ
ncbi:VOC family protein [Nocardia blacklockiae]|uniref:VOC family protein n=1 Tax=Nocardia blacklockiae TaxID=480036 RepID=UPI00189359B3|nr:VOC family protein [Nocardia blacklockiae]MBF6172662.1 VOC family protein [Nocardia blacklockiae]